MGVRPLMRAKKTHSHRGRRSTPYYLLVLLVVCGTVAVANGRRQKECSVDRCSEVFRAASYAKTNLEHCKKLKVHKKCLGRMKKVCRGNLMYHSNVHINKARMKEYDCLNVFNNISKPPTTPPAITKDSLTCRHKSKGEYKFCGVFGDPHIRTFNDELITCKTNGSWTLVENDYLVVMATNAIVSHDTGATATVKLTVIIKEHEDCVKTNTYRADVNRSLPPTFIDGSTSSGPHSTVNITLRDPETEIQINIQHIDTTLIIRKIGGHLTFAITIPEEFTINPKQRQMCFDGCPKDMQLSHPELLKKSLHKKVNPKFNEQQAKEYCRKAMLEELNPCTGPEEEVVTRERREADDKKNRRSKKEVTPPSSMLREEAISAAHRRMRYTQEDAAIKSWRQLSSGDTNSKQNRRKRKRKRGRERRPKDDSNIPVAEESHAESDVDKKFKDFQEKVKQKLNPVNENKIIKNETNFYFEACVFDLRTTGDVTYAKSARAAYDDVTKMHSKGGLAPSASKHVLCSLDPYKEPMIVTQRPSIRSTSGSTSSHGSFIFVILCSILTTSFLNFNILIFLSSMNVGLFNRSLKT